MAVSRFFGLSDLNLASYVLSPSSHVLPRFLLPTSDTGRAACLRHPRPFQRLCCTALVKAATSVGIYLANPGQPSKPLPPPTLLFFSDADIPLAPLGITDHPPPTSHQHQSLWHCPQFRVVSGRGLASLHCPIFASGLSSGNELTRMVNSGNLPIANPKFVN